MPWHVTRSEECPSDKPFAVIADNTGEVESCNETEEDAKRHMRALYANVPDAQGASTQMQHKTFHVETKADGDAGEFSALASVFGNVDRVGDRMLKGSFRKTLEKWRKSGKPLPVVLSHDWANPHAYVGKADPRAVVETEEGLLVQGMIDVSDEVGRKVYKLMKERILTGWSFGYSVPPGGQKRKGKVNEISEVDLFEVGPTLVGANPDAQLQDIKSALGVETEQPEEEAADESEEAEGDVEPDAPPADPLRDESRKAVISALTDDLSADEKRKAAEEVRDAVAAQLVELAELRQMREEFDKLRADHEELQKAFEDRRNEEPKRAKSPPDPLRDESRRAVMQALTDDLSVEEKKLPEPEPEPEPIDRRELKERSRAAVLSVLKGDMDGD